MNDKRQHLLKSLPNWLTLLRLAMIPVFIALMHQPAPGLYLYAATAVFGLAAITDWIDGFLARRFGAVSDLGKLLDPLADKILVMAALVMLVAQRSEITGEPWVPGWVVVLILAREIWVTGLRGMAASRGVIVAAGSAGKVKSGLQMLAIIFLLLHQQPVPFLPWRIPCSLVGMNLLLLSIAFSLWSAAEYTAEVMFASRNAAEAEPEPEPGEDSGRSASENEGEQIH